MGPNWRDSGAEISFFSQAGAAAIEDTKGPASQNGPETEPATKPVSPPLFSRSQVTCVGSLSSPWLPQNQRFASSAWTRRDSNLRRSAGVCARCRNPEWWSKDLLLAVASCCVPITHGPEATLQVELRKSMLNHHNLVPTPKRKRIHRIHEVCRLTEGYGDHAYQIVFSVFDRRIPPSAVIRGGPSTSAVAPITRSAGSLG